MSPLSADRAAVSAQSLAPRLARTVAYLLATRDEDQDCHPQPNIDLCEKTDAAQPTTTIVVGSLGGLLAVATIGTLLFLHFRRKRIDKREWPKNNQELDDYGIGPVSTTTTTTTTTATPTSKPKNTYRQPRVEPDDGDDLPTAGRGDSLQSLERSLRSNPEAYRSRPDDTSYDMKPVEPASQL